MATKQKALTPKQVSRKTVCEVVVSDISGYEFEGKLSELIARLQLYEKDHGSDAYVSYGQYSGYDDHYGFQIEVNRPETDAEMSARLTVERSAKLAQEERDRKQYEELKKKFEKK